MNNPSTLRRFCLQRLLYPQRYHSNRKLLLNLLAGATRALHSPQVEIIADNSMFMDDQAHVGDESLLQELVHMPFNKQECLGIVLVSQLSTCAKFGANFISLH